MNQDSVKLQTVHTVTTSSQRAVIKDLQLFAERTKGI